MCIHQYAYIGIYQYTQVYMSIHVVYMGIHQCTPVYIHRYIPVYIGIHAVHMGIHVVYIGTHQYT